MLHRVLLTAVSVVALSAAATAADLNRPSYKDVPYVGVNWSGFYIGVNGGYGENSGTSSVADGAAQGANAIAAQTTFGRSGGFGGGQIGYNVQRDHAVFGVEADFQGSGINGSGSAVESNNGGLFLGTAKGTSSLDWFGSVRGRLGYTFDRALVYGTAGVAFGGVKDNLSLKVVDAVDPATTYTGAWAANANGTLTGYVVGAGVEYLVNPAWSVKAEYQYLDLGSSIETIAVGADGNGITVSAKEKVDHTYNTVRVGLNYHIGGGYDPLK